MEWNELIEKLGFCLEAEKSVRDIDKTYDHSALESSWKKLYDAGQAEEGLFELRAAFGEDPDGMKMLTCMLHCALYTHALIRKKGSATTFFSLP